jgi:hypothetical protein
VRSEDEVAASFFLTLCIAVQVTSRITAKVLKCAAGPNTRKAFGEDTTVEVVREENRSKHNQYLIQKKRKTFSINLSKKLNPATTY